MLTVTLKQFKGFGPCWLDDGREDKLEKIGARKAEWTALDVLKLRGVSDIDKLWAVLRVEFIPEPILHEFACRCAERALKAARITDERSWNAIKTKRKWLKGEATDEELVAARDAAYAARDAAAWAAARDAAAERKWQVAELRKMLEEVSDGR